MKRGQVTIFIILGIMVLLAGAVYVFLSNDDTFEDEFKRVADTPFDIAPVYDYIDACVTDLAKKGLVMIGEHGGYVSLDQRYSGTEFRLDILEPYQADAVTFGVDPDFAIPYWWYMDSDVECISCHMSLSKRPSSLKVFEGLDLYIKESLDQCINDFTPLREVGYDFRMDGDIVVGSYGQSDAVTVDMEYPLTIIKDGKDMPLSKFQVKIDLDFISMFSLAQSISESLIDDQSFERITMSMIGIFSGLDPAKLPPLAALTDSYTTVTWSKTITRFRMQSLLLQYLSFIQINNTRDAMPIDGGSDPYVMGLFKTFYLDVLDKEYPEYTVRVLYLDWPIYLDISPSSGDLLKPSVFRDSFPLGLGPDVQTNTYEFFYDISYPVIILIENRDAFSGQGYRFMFAHEVNIKDNYNAKEWFDGNGTVGYWSFDEVSYDPDPSVGSFAADNLFCNENQKIGSDVVITVADGVTGDPVRDVKINYACGSYQACVLDKTGADGILQDKLPVCIGGFIKAEKDGYETATYLLDSVIDGDESIDIGLFASKHFDVDVKKKEITSSGGIGPEQELSDSEDVFIMVKKKQESADAFNVNKAQNIMISSAIVLNDGIYLSPGEYEISAIMIDNEGFIIPKECQRICTSYDITNDCDEYSYIPEDPVEMIPGIQGGLEIGESSGYWEVTQDDIDQNSALTIFVIKVRTPTCLSEDTIAPGGIGLSELGLVSNYTSDHMAYLAPRFG